MNTSIKIYLPTGKERSFTVGGNIVSITVSMSFVITIKLKDGTNEHFHGMPYELKSKN